MSRRLWLGAVPAGAVSLAWRRAARAADAPLLPGRLALTRDDGLWLAERNGSRRRLVRPTGLGGWLQDPAWSPDGALLAYTDIHWPANAFQPGAETPWPIGEVSLISPAQPDATPSVAVRQETPKEVFVSAAWAADGRALYAVRRRPAPGSQVDAISDVVRVDLGSGRSETLDLGLSPSEVAVDRDGTLAIVGVPRPALSGSEPDRLYLIAPDGTRTELAAATPETGLQALSLPRFGPDGRVAFAAGSGDPVTPARTGGLLPVAQAHGVTLWPWIADPRTGALRRGAGPGYDDLGGLAWLDAGRLLVLDVSGLAVAGPEGVLQRLPDTGAHGLAWQGD